MLSDRGIKAAIDAGDIAITPFTEDRLQPASIDLTLHPVVRKPRSWRETMDLGSVRPDHTEAHSPGHFGTHHIGPGEQLLACTAETVRLGRMHVGRVEGKSSLARLWLSVHVTGGFIDPGFEGQVTLEMVNMSPWTIILYPGMPVCQIAFDRLDTMPEMTYKHTGRYQGQSGPTESRYTL